MYLEEMALPGMKGHTVPALVTTEWPPTTPAWDHSPVPQPGVADQAHWPGVVVWPHGCWTVTEYLLSC